MVLARRCLGSEEHPSCEDPWCEDPSCEDPCREDPPHHTPYAAVGGTTGDRDVIRGLMRWPYGARWQGGRVPPRDTGHICGHMWI